MGRPADCPWPSRDDELRRLWDYRPKYSTYEIGELMGMTKNQIVGRAHRMNLEQRPSPIKPRLDGQPMRPRSRYRPPLVGPTLPPLPSELPFGSGHVTVDAPKPAVAPKATPFYIGRVTTCVWPESNRRPWLFCEAPTIPGKNLCPKHDRLAHPRAADLRQRADYTDSERLARRLGIP